MIEEYEGDGVVLRLKHGDSDITHIAVRNVSEAFRAIEDWPDDFEDHLELPITIEPVEPYERIEVHWDGSPTPEDVPDGATVAVTDGDVLVGATAAAWALHRDRALPSSICSTRWRL